MLGSRRRSSLDNHVLAFDVTMQQATDRLSGTWRDKPFYTCGVRRPSKFLPV